MAAPRPCLGAVIVFLVLGAGGCNGPNDTEGTAGRLRFAYWSSCVFGCVLDHAMMSGTSEDIDVTPEPGGDLPGVTATTDDPSVASVEGGWRNCVTSTGDGTLYEQGDLKTPCTASLDTGAITVAAHSPGATVLRVLRLDGSLLDSVALEVAAAAKVGLECNSSTIVLSIGMTVDQTCGLTPVAFDANDTPLQATQGIVVTSLDPSVALLNGLQSGSTQQLVAESVGHTLLVATSGALGVRIPVNVTDDDGGFWP
jgi:hypothetical protein